MCIFEMLSKAKIFDKFQLKYDAFFKSEKKSIKK